MGYTAALCPEPFARQHQCRCWPTLSFHFGFLCLTSGFSISCASVLFAVEARRELGGLMLHCFIPHNREFVLHFLQKWWQTSLKLFISTKYVYRVCHMCRGFHMGVRCLGYSFKLAFLIPRSPLIMLRLGF
jgi:hypothetical protein